MSIPNTPSTRRSILKTLRYINRLMRSEVSHWNPNQTGAFDLRTGQYDPSAQMPTAELPEHDALTLERTVRDMDSVIELADSVRHAARAMLEAIDNGRDPDARQ